MQEETIPYSIKDGTTTADIKVRDDEKNRGVIFDPSMKLNKHVKVVVNKGNRICWPDEEDIW